MSFHDLPGILGSYDEVKLVLLQKLVFTSVFNGFRERFVSEFLLNTIDLTHFLVPKVCRFMIFQDSCSFSRIPGKQTFSFSGFFILRLEPPSDLFFLRLDSEIFWRGTLKYRDFRAEKHNPDPEFRSASIGAIPSF